MAASTPEAHRVDLPSSQLHLQVSGQTENDPPTMILIPGLSGGIASYEPLLAFSGVERGYRVVRFELEGQGLSPLSRKELSIAVFVRSVKEVLDHVGAREAVVVGHSMGGVSLTNPHEESIRMIWSV